MTNKSLSCLFFAAVLTVLWSCNDTGYEIQKEETEDAPKTETHSEIKQDVAQPKTEIRQDAVKDTAAINKLYSKYFAIQIGAFQNESNAIDFIAKSRSMLNFDLDYMHVNGLFKVRAGKFISRNDAVKALLEIAALGFKDAFVAEVNK